MKNIKPYLTFAGIIPFVVTSLLISFDMKYLPLIGDVREVLFIYALAIISFISGSYWGIVLNRDDFLEKNLAFASNAIVLIVWISYIIFSPPIFTGIIILSFIALLGIDKVILRKSVITEKYYRIRFIASILVIAFLCIALINL